jgi:hypothetical protein
LSLKDDVKDFLNSNFKKAGFPIEIEKILFYRPTFHELPFEHIEVISDISRINICEALYVIFKMNYKGRGFEYEARFNNNNGELIYRDCFLKHFDIFPNEELDVIAKKMEEEARFVCLLIAARLNALNS